MGFWCGENEIALFFKGWIFMNRWSVLGISMLLCFKAFGTQIYVFVSFSMPEQLLSELVNESARLRIPALLNGLIDNSMPKTVKKMEQLAKSVPGFNLQIDPTAFERFGIQQVPALVVEHQSHFDVLYGNLTLKEGLLRIATHGDSGLSVADVRRRCGD
jgi:conjugal transfer pilus assembly protein TrbC